MTKTIVNLAFSVVVEEAEAILSTYPYHPYQHIFSFPETRQKLISYVLSRIPGHYTVVEQDVSTFEKTSIDVRSLYASSKERLLIEALVHQGIRNVLSEEKNESSFTHERHAEVEAPSNWFG